MEINRKIIEKIGDAIGGSRGEVNVSLFIVSSTQPRLKKLDLAQLNPEQRAAKLHKWGQQNRFVAVIEKGDQVFAHLCSEHAVRLQGMADLSIEGKKVTVNALSDEEYDQLSIIGEAFEDYLLAPEEEKESAVKSDLGTLRSQARQFLASKQLLSDEMKMNFVIASMQNIPGQVILNCLRLMNDARRDAEKQKREDDKRNDIKEQQLRKDILKSEVTKNEIKQQTLKQDSARINRIRSHS